MHLPKFRSKAFLAPMAGHTNIAFRLLCQKYGAGLCVGEMISSDALVRNNQQSLKMLDVDPEENPSTIQLFGGNIDTLCEAAKIMEKHVDIVDLNFGCPVKHIMDQGAGAAWLHDEKRLAECIKQVSSAIKKPLTCKFRVGISKSSADPVKTAKICEENGAKMIALHGRTQAQGYQGKADWDMIKLVKENISIPVVGNGDITSPQEAKRMLETTNCDFVMIGRAALGNPFLFRQIDFYFKTGELLQNPSYNQQLKIFFEYVKLLEKYPVLSPGALRMHAQNFTKSFPGSAKLRLQLNTCKTTEEIVNILQHFYQ